MYNLVSRDTYAYTLCVYTMRIYDLIPRETDLYISAQQTYENNLY